MNNVDNIYKRNTSEDYKNPVSSEDTKKRMRIEDECLETEKSKRKCNINNNNQDDFFPLLGSSLLSSTDFFDFQHPLSPLSSECMSFIMESLFDDENKKINKQQDDNDEFDSQQQQQEQDYMSPLQAKAISNHVLVQSPKQLTIQIKTTAKHNHIEWSAEEDSKLLDLHDKYGNQWAIIAKYLPGKSRIEVKTRYRSFRRAAKRYWSDSQDKLLMDLYVQYGYNWNEAIAAQFPTKTKLSVKNRLNELLRQNNNDRYPSSNSLYQTLSSRPGTVDSLLKSDN